MACLLYYMVIKQAFQYKIKGIYLKTEGFLRLQVKLICGISFYSIANMYTFSKQNA